MKIKAEKRERSAHFFMEWQPISSAPFDRDLELAVIDATGIHALVFQCRRVLRGWLNAKTSASVQVHPTHWRYCDNAVSPVCRHDVCFTP
jgi:hypothetical protein